MFPDKSARIQIKVGESGGHDVWSGRHTLLWGADRKRAKEGRYYMVDNIKCYNIGHFVLGDEVWVDFGDHVVQRWNR